MLRLVSKRSMEEDVLPVSRTQTMRDRLRDDTGRRDRRRSVTGLRA